VISLIEQLKLKQPNAADVLEEAAGQIGAIAVVHGLQSRTLEPEVRPRQLVLAIVDSVSHFSRMPISCSQTDDPSSWEWKLSGRDAVSIALVVNELIYNAIKHTKATSEARVTVGFECQPGAFSILVRNGPATLPSGFDWSRRVGLGTGLSLIASLLPTQGAALQIHQLGDVVEAHLQLCHPCVDTLPGRPR
jgi:two-component sensor histidine kinase